MDCAEAKAKADAPSIACAKGQFACGRARAHAHASRPPRAHAHLDARRAGVERVLDELLDGAREVEHDLAAADAPNGGAVDRLYDRRRAGVVAVAVCCCCGGRGGFGLLLLIGGAGCRRRRGVVQLHPCCCLSGVRSASAKAAALRVESARLLSASLRVALLSLSRSSRLYAHIHDLELQLDAAALSKASPAGGQAGEPRAGSIHQIRRQWLASREEMTDADLYQRTSNDCKCRIRMDRVAKKRDKQKWAPRIARARAVSSRQPRQQPTQHQSGGANPKERNGFTITQREALYGEFLIGNPSACLSVSVMGVLAKPQRRISFGHTVGWWWRVCCALRGRGERAPPLFKRRARAWRRAPPPAPWHRRRAPRAGARACRRRRQPRLPPPPAPRRRPRP